MTRIFMVRHGQTSYNAHHLYQGQLDTPLNETGIEQANALKERILKSKLHIDEIWSSDLQRARNTIAPIAEVLSLPLHLHAGLREVHVGDFTDKSNSLVKEIYKEKLEEMEKNWKESAYPNGESNAEVSKRIYKTVCEIAEKNDGKTLLIASHGGAMHCLVSEIFERLGMKLPEFSIPNCSIFTFEYENGTIVLKSMENAKGEEISVTYNDKKDVAVL